MIRWWVGLWDRREAPTSLAVVRILVGALILVDLLQLARLDLIVPLYAPRPSGGMAGVLGREVIPELYRWWPATAETATAAFWLTVAAAVAFTLGLATRLSGLLLLLLLAQLALILPPADRGIDMLLRNTLMVLVFSRCGAALSLDARLIARRWAGDGRPVPSWPRYLLVVQLALLYSSAGMQKVAGAWLPPDWSALWVALRDPHFARFSWPWIDDLFVLTQAATAVTWLWEWLGPVILLAFWYRDTADRPGRLRAFFNRHHVLAIYLVVGALFHLGTHVGLRLGIFPFAVLSLYPAAVHPETWGAWGRRLRGVRS